MKAIFRDDCWRCDSSFVENFGEVSWIVNSIPWIEAFEQIRPHILDRAPECVTPRLEEIRSPCGHRQLAAWSNATPEFTHSSCHVGTKKIPNTHTTASKLLAGNLRERISPTSNSILPSR